MFIAVLIVLLLYGMLHLFCGVWGAALLIRINQELIPIKSTLSMSIITAIVIVMVSAIWIFWWLIYCVTPVLSSIDVRVGANDILLFLIWLFLYVSLNSELIITLLKSGFNNVVKVVGIVIALSIVMLVAKPVYHNIFYRFYLEYNLTRSDLNSDYLENNFQKYENDKDIRKIIARHPNTPGSRLALIGRSSVLDERRYVAQNRSTPSGTLMALAKDRNVAVRSAILENPKIPWLALEALMQDENSYVRDVAKSRLEHKEAPYIQINNEFKRARLRQDIDYLSPAESLQKLHVFTRDASSTVWIWFVCVYLSLLFIMARIYRKTMAESSEVFDAIGPGWIVGIGALAFVSAGLLYSLVNFDDVFFTWFEYLGEWRIIFLCFMMTLYLTASCFISCRHPNLRLLLKVVLVVAVFFFVPRYLKYLSQPVQHVHSLSSIDSAPVEAPTDMYRIVATNHSAHPDLLKKVFSNNRLAHGELAANLNSSDEILEGLSNEREYLVQTKLIDNPNISCDILRKITELPNLKIIRGSGDSGILEESADNSTLSHIKEHARERLRCNAQYCRAASGYYIKVKNICSSPENQAAEVKK